MIRKIYDNNKATLSFVATGKLSDLDYQSVFIPQVEEALQHTDKINLLWKMERFEGWDTHAMWDEVVLAFKMRDSIGRIALVGEEPWQVKLTDTLKHLTHADVQYYDQHKYQEAQEWLKH